MDDILTDDRGRRILLYSVVGINPATGIQEEYHRTATRYGACVAGDSAIESGWKMVTIRNLSED